jgi:hypothetical protein
MQAQDAARTLAGEIGHPYSRATALVFAAMLALDMRDRERLRQYVAALKDGHTEQDATQTRISIEALDGFVDVLDGRKEAGISRIRRVLDDSRGAEHAPGQHAMVVRVLLEACSVAGAARIGLEVAERALAIKGARVWEAETHRLRGEFLAALGGPADEVDEAFENALQVAQHQGAYALALRAAMSLVSFRVEYGGSLDAREAYDLLADLVAGLPETYDTPDLREATTILARR